MEQRTARTVGYKAVKWSLTRDFLLQVFFMNQFSSGYLSTQFGPLQIFTKIRGVLYSTGEYLSSNVPDFWSLNPPLHRMLMFKMQICKRFLFMLPPKSIILN